MRAIAFPFLFFVCLLNSCGKAEERNEFAANLAPLLDPAKLDSLKGKRAATPRLRKICYWLEMARREERDPREVIDQAHTLQNLHSAKSLRCQKGSLFRNRII
jgi:hypothetical protein